MKHLKRKFMNHPMAAVSKNERDAWMAEMVESRNEYLWHTRDEEGRRERGLMHPDAWRRWIQQGPSVGCPCSAWCDRICTLRAQWWDDRVGRWRR